MLQSKTGSPLVRRSAGWFSALLLAGSLLTACDSGSTANYGSQPAQPAVAQAGDKGQQSDTTPDFIPANRQNTDSPLAPVPAIGPAPSLPALEAKGSKVNEFVFDNPSAFASFTTVDLSGPEVVGAAKWAVVDGALVQQGDADGLTGLYDTFALNADSGNNYTAQAVAYSTGVPLGLVARYSAAGHYLLRVNPTNSKAAGWSLERYDAASQSYTVLAQGAVASGYTRFNWVTLGLTVNGSTLTATLAGRALGTATDATFAAGQAGLYAEASNGARFASFRIAQQ